MAMMMNDDKVEQVIGNALAIILATVAGACIIGLLALMKVALFT